MEWTVEPISTRNRGMRIPPTRGGKAGSAGEQRLVLWTADGRQALGEPLHRPPTLGCSRSARALPSGILRTPAVSACTMCLVLSSIRLMSEVLYARVPAETKGAIDAFAGANGRSVAAAVA